MTTGRSIIPTRREYVLAMDRSQFYSNLGDDY